jgi:hypothetical protein
LYLLKCIHFITIRKKNIIRFIFYNVCYVIKIYAASWIRDAADSRIIAKIKTSRKIPDLQYNIFVQVLKCSPVTDVIRRENYQRHDIKVTFNFLTNQMEKNVNFTKKMRCWKILSHIGLSHTPRAVILYVFLHLRDIYSYFDKNEISPGPNLVSNMSANLFNCPQNRNKLINTLALLWVLLHLGPTFPYWYIAKNSTFQNFAQFFVITLCLKIIHALCNDNDASWWLISF